MAVPIDGVAPGLPMWEGQAFDGTIVRCLRILPTAEREAFFVARIRKSGG